MWCDAALSIIAHNVFSSFWQLEGIGLLLSLSSISCVNLAQLAFGVTETVVCKLMRIGRWSEPSVVIVFQFVEVIREDDANDTSGELGVVLLGCLVGVSQFRIPKSGLQIESAKFFPLLSVDVACQEEWCALKSPSTRVSGVVIT